MPRLKLIHISVLAKDMKADTIAIREDTADLKLGQDQILAKTEDILAQLEELQSKLPRNVREHETNHIIQRYLQSIASYAGSARGETID